MVYRYRSIVLFCVIISSLLINEIIYNYGNKSIVHGEEALSIESKSAILMEGATGKIIYKKNPNEKLNPASITKIMTLLLIYESLDNGKIKPKNIVTVSEHAASMGGSQVF